MSFQLKCEKKVTEAIMLLFFVDQVNCSAGESTRMDGQLPRQQKVYVI